MMTSAMALKTLLERGKAKSSGDKTRSISYIADSLDLPEPDGELQALAHLQRVYRETVDQLEELELDEVTKQHFRNQLKPFSGLRTFGFGNITADQAANSYLKKENLDGLLNIHAAMIHSHRKPSDEELSDDLTAEISSLRERVANSSLPENLKKACLYRIDQIFAALSNSDIFDNQNLAEELEALVGKIVIYRPSATPESAKTMREIAAVVIKVLRFAGTFNSNISIALSSIEKGKTILSYFSDDS